MEMCTHCTVMAFTRLWGLAHFVGVHCEILELFSDTNPGNQSLPEQSTLSAEIRSPSLLSNWVHVIKDGKTVCEGRFSGLGELLYFLFKIKY